MFPLQGVAVELVPDGNGRRPCRPFSAKPESLSFHSTALDLHKIQTMKIRLVLANNGSVARDHLSLERTFLSYVRTSLALACAGVAVVQFCTLASTGLGNIQAFARPLGASTVVLAIALLVVGVIRFYTLGGEESSLSRNKMVVALAGERAVYRLTSLKIDRRSTELCLYF
ncbi:uncharacterized protein ARMOST_01824 [Armillaria ostoyae]|uniref:DUF202 domain-containing protein n=1 Tax=Armillaria ostoyae TaxID=47428 RepID=A0A284QQ04_ARMOS|nr:uncharacterized protein ARMOST_01824 [Armillaria ostoyae]